MKKTVMITGASTGIGRASAELFKARGWNVIATMRKPEQATVSLKDPAIFLTALDVTDEASIDSAIKKGLEKFGSIDVVVNNAGYGMVGAFEAASKESIKRQFDTNVFGLMSVVRAILPHFREKRSGTIINISSVGGRSTFPLYSLYHSTKFAVEGFTDSIQYELEPLGIRMKLVEPGPVLTDFSERSADKVDISGHTHYQEYQTRLNAKLQDAAKNAQTPDQVAEVIYKAATDNSSRLRYVSGGLAKQTLMLRWLLPDFLFRRLIKAML